MKANPLCVRKDIIYCKKKKKKKGQEEDANVYNFAKKNDVSCLLDAPM